MKVRAVIQICERFHIHTGPAETNLEPAQLVQCPWPVGLFLRGLGLVMPAPDLLHSTLAPLSVCGLLSR